MRLLKSGYEVDDERVEFNKCCLAARDTMESVLELELSDEVLMATPMEAITNDKRSAVILTLLISCLAKWSQ